MLLSQRLRSIYYKTLVTSVINSPMSVPSLPVKYYDAFFCLGTLRKCGKVNNPASLKNILKNSEIQTQNVLLFTTERKGYENE